MWRDGYLLEWAGSVHKMALRYFLSSKSFPVAAIIIIITPFIRPHQTHHQQAPGPPPPTSPCAQTPSHLGRDWGAWWRTGRSHGQAHEGRNHGQKNGLLLLLLLWGMRASLSLCYASLCGLRFHRSMCGGRGVVGRRGRVWSSRRPATDLCQSGRTRMRTQAPPLPRS